MDSWNHNIRGMGEPLQNLPLPPGSHPIAAAALQPSSSEGTVERVAVAGWVPSSGSSGEVSPEGILGCLRAVPSQ